MRGLGADEVINYKEAEWGEVLKGQAYDCILDCVGVYCEWEGVYFGDRGEGGGSRLHF